MTPDGWARAALAQVVVHLGRGTSPKYASDPSPMRAVNQKCVRNGRVGIEHVRPHEPTAPVKPDSVLRTGDVCVNSTGTGTIGRVGLWEPPSDGTYFADTHVTVVRPDRARVVPKFLSESLIAPWSCGFRAIVIAQIGAS
jgi:type I restriction enzyme S subunit